MDDLKEELIQAITIVAASTGLTVNECITEALKILKEEQRKYKKHNFDAMFRKWS